ncbi:hypothetical protein ACS0PU_006155 [Formica fusca]
MTNTFRVVVKLKQQTVGHRGAQTVHEMRQIFGADVYDEIAILKGLRYRQGDHPKGATKEGVGRVGPNADHAETDLDRATDSAVEDGRIDLRVHFQSSAFE